MSSSSPVVTPGTTSGAISSRISAARRPARAHARERLGAVQLDDAVAGLDPVVVGDGDIFGHRPQIVATRHVERKSREREGAMDHARIWTAALVVIGDEILSGRTQDKNIAQVATWLNVQGIRLAEVRVVPDDQRADRRAVNALRAAPRLSVHDRRHRPDPRRHHRRLDRRGVRRAGGGPSRSAAHPRGLLRGSRASSPNRGCGWRGCRKAPS